jgi:hypothetical protein
MESQNLAAAVGMILRDTPDLTAAEVVKRLATAGTSSSLSDVYSILFVDDGPFVPKKTDAATAASWWVRPAVAPPGHYWIEIDRVGEFVLTARSSEREIGDTLTLLAQLVPSGCIRRIRHDGTRCGNIAARLAPTRGFVVDYENGPASRLPEDDDVGRAAWRPLAGAWRLEDEDENELC